MSPGGRVRPGGFGRVQLRLRISLRLIKINILEVLIWGFGVCRMFLTGVWYLCLGLDMVTGLSYTHVPNFGSHLDFEGTKNIHVL